MRIGGLQHCSLIDYPGQICAVVFTTGCNFRCHFCHNPELVDCTADDIPEDDVLNFLRSRVGKLDAVAITGGEPTLHADLLDFVGKIRELGFKIKLDSNGTNTDKLAEAYDKKLVDYVAMDIKSPLPDYEKTIDRPVEHDNISKSIELIMNSGVPYEFRTTVVKSLLASEDFPKIGEMIEGAEHYYLQKFIPSKTLDLNFMHEHTYTDEEFEGFKKVMERYVVKCSIRT